MPAKEDIPKRKRLTQIGELFTCFTYVWGDGGPGLKLAVEHQLRLLGVDVIPKAELDALCDQAYKCISMKEVRRYGPKTAISQ